MFKKTTIKGKNRDMLEFWNVLNAKRAAHWSMIQEIEDLMEFVEVKNKMEKSEKYSAFLYD